MVPFMDISSHLAEECSSIRLSKEFAAHRCCVTQGGALLHIVLNLFGAMVYTMVLGLFLVELSSGFCEMFSWCFFYECVLLLLSGV